MVQILIAMPEGALAALHKDPDDFAKEMRLAAAVKWYEMRALSQERAAEVAGLSRSEFLDALGRFGVTPFQYGADEILTEARSHSDRAKRILKLAGTGLWEGDLSEMREDGPDPKTPRGRR